MSMLSLERQSAVIDILNRKKSVRVSELAKLFYTCESTIRRDLEKLERMRLVKRTYGGAVLLEGLNTEIPLSVREHEQADEKSAIGLVAAGLVRDGDSLILDSSSTTYRMLSYLKDKKDLVIITNGLKTAAAAGEALDCRVYCTGGALRENSSSLIGGDAERYVRRRSAQKLFFSCRAVSPSLEAMDVSDGEAELRRVMMECAAESYLLCDHTKLGKTALNIVAPLTELSALITDRPPEEAFAAAARAGGVPVLCGDSA